MRPTVLPRRIKEIPLILDICDGNDVFEILDVLSVYDEYFDAGMLAELKTNGFNLDIVNKIACNYSVTYFKINTRSQNG